MNPPERSPLPPDALLNCEITITSYITGGGVMKYAVHVEGDANLAQAIGLCELAKPSIQEMYEGQYAEEEEDDGQD